MASDDRLRAALLRSAGLDPVSRRRKLMVAARLILAEWQSEARRNLNSLRRPYLASLAIASVTAERAVVELAGEGVEPQAARLARMAESGMGPGGVGTTGRYDIRVFALKAGTRSLRWGKQGPYLNVPFDRSVKEIKALGGAAAMRQARLLAETIAVSGGVQAVTQWGERLPSGLAPKVREHHVADPLAGLVRLASSYSQADDGSPRTQTSGYRLWRRMSWAGQPWWHPGIRPRKLGQRVQQRVPYIVRGVF